MAPHRSQIIHLNHLTVLDTYPKEWSEDGDLNQLGPDLAQSWAIWEGEMCVAIPIVGCDVYVPSESIK